MSITGIHHITLVCSNAQRTVDFYVGVLGQRMVKQTVNFDDPGEYHLYFGDEGGAPGSAITFFEWKELLLGGRGLAAPTTWPCVADYAALLQWKRRLTDLGITVNGPLDRHYFTSIYFRDPDGTILEIATDGPGWTRDEAPDALGQLHRRRQRRCWSPTGTKERIQALLAAAGPRHHGGHGADAGDAPHHGHQFQHRAHPRLFQRHLGPAPGEDDRQL